MFVTFLYLAGLCSPLIDARSLRGTMNPHAGTPGAALRSPPAIDAFPSGEQNVFGTNVHRPPTPGAALRLPPAIDAFPSGEQNVFANKILFGINVFGTNVHRPSTPGAALRWPRLLTRSPPGNIPTSLAPGAALRWPPAIDAFRSGNSYSLIPSSRTSRRGCRAAGPLSGAAWRQCLPRNWIAASHSSARFLFQSHPASRR